MILLISGVGLDVGGFDFILESATEEQDSMVSE